MSLRDFTDCPSSPATNPRVVGTYYVVGLVYNYRNSLSEDFTGDAKNVL